MIVSPPRESSKSRTTAKAEAPRITLREGRPEEGAFARFLELPPALVLAVLWLMGVALLALCGLALYLVETALA